MASRMVSRRGIRSPLLLLSVMAAVVAYAPAALSATPSLEELVRASEDILLQMRAGKIRFRVQHTDTAGGALERLRAEERERVLAANRNEQAFVQGKPEAVQRQSADSQRQRSEICDQMATLTYLRDYGDDNVEMRFDRDRHACWVMRTSRREWGPLIDQYALGESGLMNLPLSIQSARMADAIVTHTVYRNHQKVTYFKEPGASRQEEAMLEWGLLLRKRLSGLAEYGHRIEDVDGMVELTFSKRRKSDLVFVLDPALGLRISEERTVSKQGIVERRKLSYRTFGSTLWPCEYATTEYGPDGTVVEETIYQVSDASFADSLDASEFLLELPPGARVRSQVTQQEAALPESQAPPGTAPLRLGVEDIGKLFPAKKP